MHNTNGQSRIITGSNALTTEKSNERPTPWVLLVEASFPDSLRGWTIAEVANQCLGEYVMYKMRSGESVRDTLRRVLAAGELTNQSEAPLYIMRRVGTMRKDANSPTGRRVDP